MENGHTMSEAAFTLSTAPMGSSYNVDSIPTKMTVDQDPPPWLISVPVVGSSTKTTSPKTDCAWSVIDTIPIPVESSKTTASWSAVYRFAARNENIVIWSRGKLRTDDCPDHLGPLQKTSMTRLAR